MDWLKDEKNQPIVAGILIGIIVIVGVCMWLFVFRKPAATPAPVDQTAQTTPGTLGAPGMDGTMAPGMAPGAPGDVAGATGQPAASGTPGAAPAAATATATQVAAGGRPMETWRGDPFQPIGYKPPRPGQLQPKPHIRDFPFEALPNRSKGPEDNKKETPEIQQPSRRMAGILLNDRVFAILEANGVSEVVQPGDRTKDGLATVQRIEADRVVLKTIDEKPRYITVRMAASPIVQTPVMSNPVNVGAPGMPGGRMGPMAPMPMTPRRGGPPEM